MAVAHILRQKGTSVVTVEPSDTVQTIVDMLARHRIGAVVERRQDAPVEADGVHDLLHDAAVSTSGDAEQHLDVGGQRVLLIDADMRRPRVHEIFGLNAEPGLSNILTRNAEIELRVRMRPVFRGIIPFATS